MDFTLWTRRHELGCSGRIGGAGGGTEVDERRGADFLGGAGASISSVRATEVRGLKTQRSASGNMQWENSDSHRL